MKHTEQQHISLSSCSAQRSTQSFWDHQLLQHSHSRRQLITRMLLTLFLLFTSQPLFSPVSASNNYQDGPTPTATFRPKFPTSTAGPDPLECAPGGATPIGWGTKTPNAAWSVICASCAPTGTALPTSTPFPLPPWALTMTATAQGTTTPTATATATTTPTATPQSNTLTCGASTSGIICTQITPGLLKYTGSAGTTGFIKFAYKTSTIATIYLTAIDNGGGNFISSHYGMGNGNIGFSYSKNPPYRQTLYPLPSSAFRTNPPDSWRWDYSTFNTYQNSYLDDGTNLTVDHYVAFASDYTYSFTPSWSFNFQPGWASYPTVPKTGEVYISSSPIITTPTITPTVIAGTYCSAVDDSGTSDSFGLPIITVGEAICRSAGGFKIPFSWFGIIGISLDDLIIPKVNICVEPMSFGTMVLANNEIDLDTLAYLLGALFLLMIII